MANQINAVVSKINKLPDPLRSPALTLVFGKMVPFVGTSGLKVEKLNEEECQVSIANRRKVQNHIKGVHAAAMALLAETATGYVVGMNLAEGALPLIKSLKVDYKKRTRGAMRARAWLDEAQRNAMQDEAKGEVAVHVEVSDESGTEPIQCEMIWAWVPKK